MTANRTENLHIFTREFAPQQGLVKALEKPWRDEICLNGRWQFQPVIDSEQQSADPLSAKQLKTPPAPAADGWDSTPLKVPSPWNVNSFAGGGVTSGGGGGDFRAFPSYPAQWEQVKAGWLRRRVEVPADWSGSRIRLHFEAVAGFARVYVNGKAVGEHFDPFLPFQCDITDRVVPGQSAEILLWVAHGSLFDEPGDYGHRQYVAGSFWGRHIAGIWQDVYLQKVPPLSVTDVFVQPLLDQDRLLIEVTVQNSHPEPVALRLEGTVSRWQNRAGRTDPAPPEVSWSLSEPQLTLCGETRRVPAHSEQRVQLTVQVAGALERWTPDNPALYGLVLSTLQGEQVVDRHYSRFGWRQFAIGGRRLLLNGQRLQLKSDSWHFMGVPQMSRRYAWAWYRMLKQANGNGIRLHAQIYPRFYLDMADEMGICILDETAIWHSDGGAKIDSEAYWQACRRHVRGLVRRDRNHPSVMGWSVCNETVEVARMVFHAPKKLVARNLAEMRHWVADTRELDPTREWISGDGEIYGKTGLPVFIEHYAWRGLYPLIALLRKPWGTGETGMAYYGTPAQIAKVNGDRAFESQQGRMEGVAAEAFDQVRAQRRFGASWSSVFNLVWYGLKPLALGMADTSRPPELSDGIFFGEYREGVPGYQPERLGPYCTTLNPGYDSSLPLYQGWPLLDAVSAAFSDDYRRLKNRWRVKSRSVVKTPPAANKHSVVWLSDQSAGKHQNQLKRQFEQAGLRFAPLAPGTRQLLLVDGQSPPRLDCVQQSALQSAVNQGCSLLVWHAGAAAAAFIRQLTGQPLAFYSRQASSYLVKQAHPIVRGQSNATLCFSESCDAPLSETTLGGLWTEQGSVLLEACNTDWRQWNYQGEDVKTAKVLRSEREAKPPGIVMARQALGQGEVIVSTLDFSALAPQGAPLLAALMKNLGAPLSGRIVKTPRALNRRAVLVNARLENRAQDTGCDERERITAARNGRFSLDGGKSHRLSFWIHSPRALDDLLIEPGVPKLDLLLHTDAGVSWSLNGSPMALAEVVPAGRRISHLAEGVPLVKGWNRLTLSIGPGIKMGQKPDTEPTESGASLRLAFRASHKRFLRQLITLADR